MVRFSVRLRDNTFAEWRGDYLDYKRLKRALRQQKQRELDERLSATDWELRTGSSGRSSSSGSSDPESQPLLVVSRPLFSTKTASIKKQPRRVGSSTSFCECLTEEFDKVERAYVKHLAQLRGQFELLRAQYQPTASSATRDSVRHTLVELHRMLHHLHRFALLNYTGFVKILQRHDELFPTSQRARGHRARLDDCAFADASQCRALPDQLEQMFADLFCEGNRAVARASLWTRKDDAFTDWTPVSVGIKMGACLVLVLWVVWDLLLVPIFRAERERHVVDLALTRAYPVYRGVGCCLLLHWLLGLSMYVWHSARINYRYILELDPRTTPHYADIWSDATNMSIVYLVNMLLYYKVVNGDFPEQVLLHRGYYPFALFLYAIYFYLIRHWYHQRGLLRTVLEVAAAPFFPVTFLHAFVGNYLASTVRLSQDLAWSMCFFGSQEFLLDDRVREQATPRAENSCQTNALYVEVIVPLLCALPLWWQVLQSLRHLYDTGVWWPDLTNAVKYALAQVVALFGLFHPFYGTQQQQVDAVHLDGFHMVWIALFTLTSLYAWSWDVWMDWGLGRPQYKFLGDRHMFARVWVYYAAIVADLFLRFAWTLSLIPPQSSPLLPLYLQPFTMVLELFRRTFWGILRLESAHLRNTQGIRREDFIPLHYESDVGDDELTSKRSGKEPLEGQVFVVKILAVVVAVVALSVVAILVHR